MTKFCIKVDKDLCQGHGVCQAEAPEIFDVTDQGQVYDTVKVLSETPSQSLYEKAKAAAAGCPNRVITVVEL